MPFSISAGCLRTGRPGRVCAVYIGSLSDLCHRWNGGPTPVVLLGNLPDGRAVNLVGGFIVVGQPWLNEFNEWRGLAWIKGTNEWGEDTIAEALSLKEGFTPAELLSYLQMRGFGTGW